jgi:hypothetical protein
MGLPKKATMLVPGLGREPFGSNRAIRPRVLEMRNEPSL